MGKVFTRGIAFIVALIWACLNLVFISFFAWLTDSGVVEISSPVTFLDYFQNICMYVGLLTLFLLLMASLIANFGLFCISILGDED